MILKYKGNPTEKKVTAMEWITDRLPDKDGEYLVAWYRTVQTMLFTVEAGWNTHRDSDGVLCDDKALSADLIKAWMPFPEYPA